MSRKVIGKRRLLPSVRCYAPSMGTDRIASSSTSKTKSGNDQKSSHEWNYCDTEGKSGKFRSISAAVFKHAACFPFWTTFSYFLFISKQRFLKSQVSLKALCSDLFFVRYTTFLRLVFCCHGYRIAGSICMLTELLLLTHTDITSDPSVAQRLAALP